MEEIETKKGGLLAKAQSVLAEVTPTFTNWVKRTGFKRCGILRPFGEYYYMTDSFGFEANQIALALETREYWKNTLSRAFEWQCFSADFNELEAFDGLFEDGYLDKVSKIFFLPFFDREHPYIFVTVEFEDDDDLTMPEASEAAIRLKNIVTYEKNDEKLIAKFDKNIEQGLVISNSQLFILSLKLCIEKDFEGIEIPDDEIRGKILESITKTAEIIISPLFRSPNCTYPGQNGEIKVAFFAKDEIDNQLLAHHIARTLGGLFSPTALKSAILLNAGICPNKKGTITFLTQG